jgi:nitric oxide reductase NorD protein
MERWLRLFANRRLAFDLFTILEDCRLDARIAVVYPGVRAALRCAQAAALASRQRFGDLPVQEALVELLLRMSLEAFTALAVPKTIAAIFSTPLLSSHARTPPPGCSSC